MGKWDAVLQGETTIAAQVFHNLPQMYKDDCNSFWQHLQAPYEITVSFILKKTTLQSHKKYQTLGTPFLRGDEMMCCNDIHTLLLECLITFL